MWTLYPQYLVFWDGRQNSPEMFKAGLQIVSRENWQEALDRYKVNTIVTSVLADTTGARWPLIDRLRDSERWALVFRDAWSLVFVRRESVEPGWLQTHEQPKSGINEVILSAAPRLAEIYPWCSTAWWELTRVHTERKEYPLAAEALDKYLLNTPSDRWAPEVKIYFKMLSPMMPKR